MVPHRADESPKTDVRISSRCGDRGRYDRSDMGHGHLNVVACSQASSGEEFVVGVTVPREKRWTSADALQPGTGSLHPMAIEVGRFSVTKSAVF